MSECPVASPCTHSFHLYLVLHFIVGHITVNCHSIPATTKKNKKKSQLSLILTCRFFDKCPVSRHKYSFYVSIAKDPTSTRYYFVCRSEILTPVELSTRAPRNSYSCLVHSHVNYRR
ncbi:hypothetical protein BDR07DRAFT_1393451 [Suillus spraguei]|nr:hypothetical protein BDR07DRAFT_1393451 [Suillus spraguei]